MKILLLITVCNINAERILNQIDCLNKHKEHLDKYNITPVFVTGDINTKASGYETIHLSSFEEKYTNLARKIVYSLDHVYNHYDFSHVIKIDDDTLFNVDRFDPSVLSYDYTGRFNVVTKNEFTITLPAYNTYETIRLYPSAYSDVQFSFATGDFYILSRNAVAEVISKKDMLESFYKEEVRISEDQFVGYVLRHEHITKFDYTYETVATRDRVLQLTSNLTSLHPVSNMHYKTILNKTPEEQLDFLMNSTSLLYRKIQIDQLKNNLKQVVFDFVNSKKLSGMG